MILKLLTAADVFDIIEHYIIDCVIGYINNIRFFTFSLLSFNKRVSLNKKKGSIMYRDNNNEG